MACQELGPYLRRELGWPLNRLGRIRLQKQDIAGAEEALARRSSRRVGSSTGSRSGASGPRRRGHRGYLDPRSRRVPLAGAVEERPPNTDLQRAPLLEAQVKIEIAAGDIARARSAADGLELVAARFKSKALLASAAHARGRCDLADGDAAGAEQSLSEAVRLWNEVGAPYEAALTRMDLAEAHHARGSDHRAVLEQQAARTILDEIQAAPTVIPAADLARRDAPDEQRAGGVNIFRRNGDYWTVIFEGTSSTCATARACTTSRGSSPIRAGNTMC